MNHTDHVDLLRDGVPGPGGVWADLGAGSGAFTLALAEILGPEATIYAVDREQAALAELERRLDARFPETRLIPMRADFTQALDVPSLDGVVMANSLHFHKEKAPIVRSVRNLLSPAGRLILVEYNVDRGNTWVPHPISFPAWERLAARCGFAGTHQIGAKPSRFLREIYSAVSANEAR
jgi:ubiquinone/menaquinone biosynthesis C-methylase UbiE